MNGIILAILAGLMLGLYALPEKFTKDFKFENTWGLFFMLTMFVVPIISSVIMLDDFWGLLGQVETSTLMKMGGAAILWGIGVMMWGKAINHIGLSLGFSIFIGTIIMVGSLLPWVLNGMPESGQQVTFISLGLLAVLVGIFCNGMAGITKEKDLRNEDTQDVQKGSATTGILIAVIGGLLATGFNFALIVGGDELKQAVVDSGNPVQYSGILQMFPIFISGGIVIAIYFGAELTRKKAWGTFKSPNFATNLFLIAIMAIFHYVASAMYGTARSIMGEAADTTGYSIFNATSVGIAIISGILAGEWANTSSKAKGFLYGSLAFMIAGIIIISYGNGLA